MNKRIRFLLCFLLALTTSAFAQETGVLPTPQQVVMGTGSYVFKTAPVVENILVDTLPVAKNADQGYVLEITPSKIVVRATTEIGAYYASLSVQQMMRHFQTDEGYAIPCMTITDYPALKYRGWMDDISRGPIPNMDFLKREIATMAQYKMNFFNLYTEHVLKLDNYPDIAPADGLTAAQIKELEAFAAQYHIEFFGNQQCLAHAEKTLRIPFYQDMADTKKNFNPGAERTYDFLKEQLETAADAYQSPFFNIDCDETEALGNGLAKTYVDSVGSAAQVYAQHILRVYNILKARQKRVMMWGDIAAKDYDIVKQLPRDILMIVWSYGAADSYVDMMAPFKKAGLEFMVAPGMSMWSTVFPSYDTYTKNIANLVRDGYQNGALGMMNTAWDDSGESLFNSAWHGMAWSAEMAWKPIEQTEPTFADRERNQRLDAFNPLFERDFVFPTSITQLMRRYEQANIQNLFQTDALYESIWDFYPSKINDDFYVENHTFLDKILSSRKDLFDNLKADDETRCDILQKFAQYVYLRQETVLRRNLLRYELYHYLKGTDGYTSAALKHHIKAQLDLLHQTKQAYLSLWDNECRQYSREIVEARFDKVAQELLDIPNHVLFSSELNNNGQAVVSMRTVFDDQEVFYTLDGRKPQVGENRYTSPLTLTQSATVRAMTRNALGEEVINERYVLLHKGLGHILKLNSNYADYKPQYAASGRGALADGLLGGNHYADGNWQGYWGSDIDVEFDLEKKMELNHLKIRFYQDIYDWIMSPNTVKLYTSSNGKDYSLYRTLQIPGVDYSSNSGGIYTLQADDLQLKTRYVRVVVENAGTLPKWHQAAGQPSYIFCDEIILN